MERPERRGLFDQSIDAEGKGQRKGDPGHGTIDEGQIENTRRRQPNGDPLPRAQAFAQENHAHQYIDQGNDKVAQACLDDVAGVDRPDVYQPVDGDQRGSGEIHADDTRRPRRRSENRPLTRKDNDRAQHEKSPDEAMTEQL